MSKTIKTKELTQNIKEKAADTVKDKASNVAIRTKDFVKNTGSEQIRNNLQPQKKSDSQSVEAQATDNVENSVRNVSERIVEISSDTSKSVVKAANKKIQGNRTEKKLSEQAENNQEKNKSSDGTKRESAETKTETKQQKNIEISDSENHRDIQKNNTKKSAKSQQNTSQEIKQRTLEKQGNENKNYAQKKKDKQDIKIRKHQAERQPNARNIKCFSADNKSVKTVISEGKTVKGVKDVPDKAKLEIKTADNAFKSAEKTARTAKEAAVNTAKIAKKTAEASRKAAVLAKKAGEKLIKAVEEATKAIAEGVKAIAAAVAGGSTVAIVIIVICLIAAIGGTFLGIFLTNDETTGTQYTMTQAVSQLTSDYYSDIQAIGNDEPYDTMEINGNVSINWKEVLAVYAVKNTNSSEGFDVATLDDGKLENLSKIVEDMNPCVGIITSKLVPVVTYTTDDEGRQTQTTTYETQKVLTVTATHISAESQATLYHFSEEEKKQLSELLSDDYDELWEELIGATGDVIVSNSSYVPKGIFTWPLQEDNSITSSYGYRYDPITGVYKFHSGLDIAAGYGTPILAAADGEVVIAGYMANGYGNYVKIKHNDTYSTLYGHCSVLLVSFGQTVKQGQVIAQVGATGYATGNHVHFEVYMLGTRVNPMDFYS